jgi:hypothetical protein
MISKTRPLFNKPVRLSLNDSWKTITHIASSNTCILKTQKIIDDMVVDFLKYDYSGEVEEQIFKEIGKLTLHKEWQKKLAKDESLGIKRPKLC